MIQLKNLSMRFSRNQVIDDISLAIKPGESVALWGSNGAGKTTILKCVIGLLRFKGLIHVGGYDVARQGKQTRRLIGYVPQELVFNDDMRVENAVQLFSTLRGIAQSNTNEVLKHVHLDGHEQKRMRELSGGMKQRLALAIAMIGNPPVLLLDEVTASLDASGRNEFISLLANIARNSGQCMLFASHRVDEIHSLATRVLTIEKGKIVEDLTTHEFHSRFRDLSSLHLKMDEIHRENAINLLNQSGYTARLNGHGIIIQVGEAQRMAAIQLLEKNRIGVESFDLIERIQHGSPQ